MHLKHQIMHLKNSKAPTTNIKIIKNKSIFLHKVKLFYKMCMQKSIFQTSYMINNLLLKKEKNEQFLLIEN